MLRSAGLYQSILVYVSYQMVKAMISAGLPDRIREIFKSI